MKCWKCIILNRIETKRAPKQYKNNPELKNAFIQGVVKADKDFLLPLFNFRNYGIKLKDNWNIINNKENFRIIKLDFNIKSHLK